MFRHVVRVTQFPGQPNEAVHENVNASLQSPACFFPMEPRLRRGDRLESEYFDGPAYVLSVKRNELPGSDLSHQEVTVGGSAELTQIAQPPGPLATTQIFHGSVGMVAGGGSQVLSSAKPNETEQSRNRSLPPAHKVFVSHADADKDLVKSLVDSLRLGIPGLDPSMIFCTSLEGMKIPDGEDFLSFIKGQLQDPALVVFVLTPNYYDSIFCVCELGAAWAMSHGTFPLLVPPLTYSDLKAVISQSQARHLDSAGMNALRDRLVASLQLPTSSTNSTSLWEEHRNAFLKELPELLKSLQPTARVPRSELIKAMDQITELQSQVQQERATNEQRVREVEAVSALKDAAEVQTAVRSAAPAASRGNNFKEVFAELRSSARSLLRGLPSVAQHALYHHFAGTAFFISADWSNDSIREEAEAAAERDYVKFEDNVVTANLDDPATERVANALGAMFEFLGEGEKELKDWVKREFSVNPSPTNRRFWEDVLGMRK